MDEELLGDSLPCLRELENKVGRKTPPGLLLWMRDAAERQDAPRSLEAEGESGFSLARDLSDKIRMLKEEMVKFRPSVLLLSCSRPSWIFAVHPSTGATRFSTDSFACEVFFSFFFLVSTRIVSAVCCDPQSQSVTVSGSSLTWHLNLNLSPLA